MRNKFFRTWKIHLLLFCLLFMLNVAKRARFWYLWLVNYELQYNSTFFFVATTAAAVMQRRDDERGNWGCLNNRSRLIGSTWELRYERFSFSFSRDDNEASLPCFKNKINDRRIFMWLCLCPRQIHWTRRESRNHWTTGRIRNVMHY